MDVKFLNFKFWFFLKAGGYPQKGEKQKGRIK